ncbi:MAG: hypothetical protein BHW65_04650 [Verrucomicrobia bacterium CAG:312_58_20]|nr:MAG: hypothetical protein BHW65_04650 [Verrucomicrobia bacterium CAG:312_58_20]
MRAPVNPKNFLRRSAFSRAARGGAFESIPEVRFAGTATARDRPHQIFEGEIPSKKTTRPMYETRRVVGKIASRYSAFDFDLM